ncbi:MAG: hypothetical protein Tsb002_20880 [Wenzhouxiangellaceae bacterium]
MEYFLNPEVIKAASQSTLGILSLMVLILGFISLAFFLRSPVWVKLIVFVFLFAGTAGFGYSIQIEANKFRQEQQDERQAQIEACVARKVSELETIQTDFIDGGARASAPGIRGGKNTATEPLCYSVGVNQEIVKATTTNLSCHGGRCSVTAPEISDNNTKVCVTTSAWSESKPFGGGGSGQYRLNVEYRDKASSTDRADFRSMCTSELDSRT